ncbi:hypothetical protein [Frankia sp. QA3]|uniref:hypothetical protein n=1 Tax=Frankia sp. QA3 TaxID=710111 RepID=UPI0002F93187|nr:hypothetical protein [Frankia sp. QA3]
MTSFTSDRSFLWSGRFPGVLGVMAEYARERHIASVDLAVIDAGSVTGTVKALGQPVSDKAGVELRLTAIAPGRRSGRVRSTASPVEMR